MSQTIIFNGPFQLFSLVSTKEVKHLLNYIFMMPECITRASDPVDFFWHNFVFFLSGEKETLRLPRNFAFNNISPQHVLQCNVGGVSFCYCFKCFTQ